MRRSAMTILTMMVLVSLIGCQEPTKQDDLQDSQSQTAAMEPDFYVTDPAAVIYDSSASEQPAYTEVAPPSSGSDATHVVAKGDTLFSLARRYYQDQSRWKEIYEANGGKILNPDMIRIGQVLVIP